MSFLARVFLIGGLAGKMKKKLQTSTFKLQGILRLEISKKYGVWVAFGIWAFPEAWDLKLEVSVNA
jgi:hypothetical protein